MALNYHGVQHSSSCPRSTWRQNKYDVFVSFRGEDTRRSFTDHLYAALELEGITSYRDDEDLERGEIIKPSLCQAIEESFSAIVVLSKNYANSTWCLDELEKILHSKNVLGLHVFPIFYGVDPSGVRHQTGNFAEAFEKHEKKFSHDIVKVQRWRNALKEVAGLAGWSSENCYETKLIEIVVDEVRSKLYDQPRFNSNDVVFNDDGLVGMDAKIAKFDLFVAKKTKGEVQFIGIWGMGGLGKTTLARAFYERRKKNYVVHFFLPNVREKSATDVGLIELQQKLFSYRNRKIKMEVGDCDEGKKLIERRLRGRKVLLVLDDVSDRKQLENLAGKKEWFGQGSTIIMTTRDQHLLVEHDVSLYQMNFLSEVESRQLFLQRAFKDRPNEDYLELSKTVINSAKGLPLALKVFGSFLCGRSKSEWEDALRKVPPNGIVEILKVSFDGLDDDEKDIFLDIACFFNGMDMHKIEQILKISGLHPEIGVPVLIEKSLLTEDGGYLRVHDMLEEMGKKIVFSESPKDAGKRSRIFSLEDANHVLGKKRGTEAIRGIVVKFDKPYHINLDPEAFSTMSNLQLLFILQGQLYVDRGLNCLSNTLKVIEWERYPLDFLPSKTQLDDLVDLKMQHSKLQELWRGTQFLERLEFIDLSHSTNLIRTPNFDQTPNLQKLILEGCTNLVEVRPSLGTLKKLVIINFKGCKSIKILPAKFEMDCLKTFVLSGCSKVKRLPEFGEGMEHLSSLDLEGTAISKLPQSLVNLIGLANLNLKNCKNLVCLPSDFQRLKALKNINIFGCSKFSRLPENLNENQALEELYVGETAIKELPDSLNNLKLLSFEGCNGYAQSSSSWYHCSLLKRAFWLQRPSTSTKFLLSPSFSNLSSLKKLHLSYCNLHDDSLSSEITNLSSLTLLDLCGNNFVEFPSSLVSKLQKLEGINFNDCQMLQSLPQLPKNVSIIKAGDCPSLKQYVCSHQLWEFIEHFESQIRCVSVISGHGWKRHFLSDHTQIMNWGSQISGFFMQPARVLTISGSEVPRWFRNQNYFCDEGCPYERTPANVSFIINKPDSSHLDEWWGIFVCLMLENDLESAKSSNPEELCWSYKDSKGNYPKSLRCCSIYVQSSCRHQLCTICIRFSSFIVEEQLQMIFFTKNQGGHKKPVFKIGQCGWRVLSKEDVECWQNTRDEECGCNNNDQLIVEEDESIPNVEPNPSDKRELRLQVKFIWPILVLFISYVALKFTTSLSYL